MSTTVDVWLLDTTRPLRRPGHTLGRIVKTKASTYIEIEGGRRFVFGVTAFFTEEAAMRRWQGNLDRIRKDRYTEHFRNHLWNNADALCRVNVYRR